MTEGPDSWFSRWGNCIVNNCPNDDDLWCEYASLTVRWDVKMTKADLMQLFTAQCDGTVGGPLTKQSVPYPLRDWMPKDTPKSTVLSSTTATSTPNRTAIDVISTGTAGPRPANSAGTTSDSKATILNDRSGSYSHSTATTTPVPAERYGSKPVLNVATIIGIAIGGTLLLAFVVGLVAFILRRRKRKQVSTPVAMPPGSREVYTKAELDGNMVTYYDTKCGEGAPANTSVVYAELDAGSPVKELAGYPVSSKKD